MNTFKPSKTLIILGSVLLIILAAYYKTIFGHESFELTNGPSTSSKRLPSTNVYDYLDDEGGTVRISFRD